MTNSKKLSPIGIAVELESRMFSFENAAFVALIKENDVLCVVSRRRRDTLHLIGGACEVGETAIQCIIREAKEETGLDLSKVSMLHLETRVTSYHNVAWREHFYVGFVTDEDIARATSSREGNDNVIGAYWTPIMQLKAWADQLDEKESCAAAPRQSTRHMLAEVAQDLGLPLGIPKFADFKEYARMEDDERFRQVLKHAKAYGTEGLSTPADLVDVFDTFDRNTIKAFICDAVTKALGDDRYYILQTAKTDLRAYLSAPLVHLLGACEYSEHRFAPWHTLLDEEGDDF